MFARREEIEEVIERIRENEPVIIVEGKKDKAALEAFQIKNIVVLNGKDIWNRMEQTVEETRRNTKNKPNKEFLILTDFDKKGKELYGKIAKNLDKLGAKVNKEYREFFQKKTKLSHVEGLATYVEHSK
ncbi:toprim domain-containing protein [Candidatus Woesearchaeota archaeon]|nr:toprim domain-containing protein [Candidatus Woesearchaeota archaeon]